MVQLTVLISIIKTAVFGGDSFRRMDKKILNIVKGIKNNKLVYIISSAAIGRIFVPTSIPESLVPYLAKSNKKLKNEKPI